MQITTSSLTYKGLRYPQEIISDAVWLYFRFSVCYRDVEELLTERVASAGLTKRCASGLGSSASPTPTTYDVDQHQWAASAFLDQVFLKINGDRDDAGRPQELGNRPAPI